MRLKITIYDEFHDRTLSGEFTGNSRKNIIAQAKDEWAMELDCNPEDINIIDVYQLA